MYVRARVSGLAYTYNFPALDPSLVLYYPLDTSANPSNGFTTPNYASKLPVYDASMAGSSMISYSLNNSITSFGDLSLNNTMGSQLVAQTTSGNYVVCNNTFTPNISGGFSISLWFSCSGQLNKTGTLISLPYNKTGNGIEIDISGTNMIYTGWNYPAYLLYDPIQYYNFDVANGAILTEIISGQNASITSSTYNVTSMSGYTTGIVNAIVGTGSINTNLTYVRYGTGSYYKSNASFGNYAILYPFNIGNSNSMTFCFWYYLTSSISQYAGFFQIAFPKASDGTYSSGSNTIQLQYISTSSLSLDLLNNSNDSGRTILSSFTNTNAICAQNTWNFFAFTITSTNPTSTGGTGVNSGTTSGTVTAYAYNSTNGLQTTSIGLYNRFSNFQNANAITSIGGNFNGSDHSTFATCYFDSVRVFKTALDSTQIQNIINLE